MCVLVLRVPLIVTAVGVEQLRPCVSLNCIVVTIITTSAIVNPCTCRCIPKMWSRLLAFGIASWRNKCFYIPIVTTTTQSLWWIVCFWISKKQNIPKSRCPSIPNTSHGSVCTELWIFFLCYIWGHCTHAICAYKIMKKCRKGIPISYL